jgi:hypothetical protein
LTASYNGDANFLASASAPANQVVTAVNLSTYALVFGNQLVGTTSTAQQVTLTNVGTTPLGIISIVWPPSNFIDSTNCPVGGTLNAGSSCRINVRFSPTTTGVLIGTLVITTNDPGLPIASVSLTGTGVQSAATLTPGSNNFGSIPRGTSTAPVAFTLSSTGTAPLTINRISLGGANPGQFTITSTSCGASLAVGANCTINVAFTPTGRGAFSATLNVRDNAPTSPQTASLTGTGL